MTCPDPVSEALKKLEKKGLMGSFLSYLLSPDEDPSPFPAAEEQRAK